MAHGVEIHVQQQRPGPLTPHVHVVAHVEHVVVHERLCNTENPALGVHASRPYNNNNYYYHYYVLGL